MSPAKRKSARSRYAVLAACVTLAALAIFVGFVPVSTRQGVNFRVQTISIPLGVKAMDFLVRDWKYRAAASEITKGKSRADERILAVYKWTRENIRRQPEGLAVIDDHILHIMIRGYGTSDQIADVFATLCTYAGHPAYWRPVRASPDAGALVLTFVLGEAGWSVVDAANGVIFQSGDGALLPITSLPGNAKQVAQITGDRKVDDLPYAAFISAAGGESPPDVLRAELQMPWKRLEFEAGRLFGRKPRL